MCNWEDINDYAMKEGMGGLGVEKLLGHILLKESNSSLYDREQWRRGITVFWGGQRLKFSDNEAIFPTKPTAVNPF